MKLLAAIRTPGIEQSPSSKEKILFWMDRITLATMPLQSARWLHLERDTLCLHFRMVAIVRAVPQHHRLLTSMENRQLVRLMAKVDHGPIKFICLKVNVMECAAFDFVIHKGHS